jgi:hypothetical protein
MLDMFQEEKDKMCEDLEQRLDRVLQTMIITEPYLYSYSCRSIRKEYKYLKKEFYIISKTLLKIKGKLWKKS